MHHKSSINGLRYVLFVLTLMRGAAFITCSPHLVEIRLFQLLYASLGKALYLTYRLIVRYSLYFFLRNHLISIFALVLCIS
jgi:hypothetical protein